MKNLIVFIIVVEQEQEGLYVIKVDFNEENKKAV